LNVAVYRTIPAVLSRVALALIVTLCMGARYTLPESSSTTLLLRMSSTAEGFVQAFYDTGAGFSERESVRAQIRPGMQVYRLALPNTAFRALRIDPGIAPGVYDIREVAVLGQGGSRTNVPLSALVPAYQLAALEQTDGRLLVRCPEGGSDPQLVFQPARAIVTPHRTTAWVLTVLVVMFVGALGAIVVLERVLAPVQSTVAAGLRALADAAARRSRLAVFLTASLATAASMYPVVFLGRSLVSPNDGGTPMLYDRPPFVPGSVDLTIEDTRASDIGAMMWAFVPYVKLERETLAHGELPLWDRYNSTGLPLWGQGLSFLLDPLHWPTLLAHDPGPGLDFKFVAHRLVFAWGAGTAALLATSAPAASLVVAAIAPFAGVFTYRFNHPAVFALSYAPWILVAWFALARAAGPAQAVRAAVLLTAASSLELVASPPKEAATLLFGCHLAGALTLLVGGSPARVRLPRLGLAAIAGVATVLLTAPHWLLFFDTLRVSSTSYDAPGVDVAGARDALAFILGNLAPGPISTGLNVVAVTLACAACAFPFRLAARTPALVCALTAAAAIAVAFGAIPSSVLVGIPLVGNIHHIDQTLMSTALVLVLVVTGAGIDALSQAPTRRAIAVVTGLTLVGAALVFSTLEGQTALEYFELELILLVLSLAVALPALVAHAGTGPNRLTAMLAAGGVMLVLVLPSGLQVETGVPAVDRLLPQPRVRAPLDHDSPAVRAILARSTEPTRVVGLNQILFSGSQALYGLEGIGGPDALRLGRYERLMDASGIQREWGWHMFMSEAQRPSLDPWLDLLNVGVLLVGSNDVPPGAPVAPVAPMEGPDTLSAVLRPSAWPRAFFVDHVIEYSELPDFVQLLREHRAPFAAVQTNDGDARARLLGLESLTGRAAQGPAVPARAYRLTANTTGFQVRAPGPGVVVLTESFMPGDFIATLNGSRAPYFRVNHAFKGLLIPAAGDWEVRFEYRPARWRLSLGLSGAGALVLLGLCVGARGARRYTAGVERSENPAARASS
jgi:hypothetical protein